MNTHSFIADFHFLRPAFLLALPLGLIFIVWIRRATTASSNWQAVIDNKLLGYLIDNVAQGKQQRWPLIALCMAWIIACTALAGPSWEQIRQPVMKKQDALVIVLDLSLSMYAEDQNPSRIVHAKRKIVDILAQRKEGLTALIVYSGDAHVVSPLTDDSETIRTMLTALEPNIMPKFGSNLPSAIRESLNLLHNSAIQKADILLITDEVSKKQFATTQQLLNKNIRLSILALGTENGAPIPLNNGFLKDDNDNTIIARLNFSELQSMAQNAGIKIVKSGFDDSDITQLLDKHSTAENIQHTQRQFDIWEDRGHWLTLLLIPLVLLSFRRGLILSLVFSSLMLFEPNTVQAMSWDDLWLTKDQQAAKAFNKGDHETAAKTFRNSQWQSAANYKNSKFDAAAEGYGKETTADALYNKGNALAKMKQFDEAIKSYDAALKLQPDMADAKDNKALLEKIRQQQKEQQQKDQQQKEQQQKEQQDDKSSEQNSEQNKEQNNQQNKEQQQQQNQQQQAKDQQQQENQQQQQQEQKQKDEQQKAQQQAEQEQKEQEQKKQAEKAQRKNDTDKDQDKDKTSQQQASQEMSPLDKEKQQALQQWLRKIPDEPGQLLKNKFQYQYNLNRQNNDYIDKDSEQVW